VVCHRIKEELNMRRFVALSLAAATLAISGTVFAAGKGKTWIDPAKARAEDPDFLVQGEYGTERGGPDTKFGVQVVALGDHKFDAYILEGGLPGAGWDKSKKRTKISGQTTEGMTTCAGAPYKVTIKNGKLTLEADGKTVAELNRIERTSPTLGAKPPQGASVLFDGSSADNWEKGRISEDKLLMEGTWSKKKLQDHSVHLEFRTPYKPHARGQGRGNSGIYVQGRYEAQMLDSFGLEGKINETGGLYSIKAPDLNMCFPPLSWQTYDIEFKAARYKDGKKTDNAVMTVVLNGVVIQKDVVCDHSTTASKLREGAEPGPIYLQQHGNPVRYRNIWVVEK
jgi:hypothetical protein